jgi:hypothetical protein
MSQMGQTEKNSMRANVFRSSADSRHSWTVPLRGAYRGVSNRSTIGREVVPVTSDGSKSMIVIPKSRHYSGGSGRRADDHFAKGLSNALRAPIALMKPDDVRGVYHPVE